VKRKKRKENDLPGKGGGGVGGKRTLMGELFAPAIPPQKGKSCWGTIF